LNIQAELVDVEKGSQLWGGQFNRQLADVSRIQEDISKEISEKLRLRLTGEDQRRLSKHYTENAEAYQLYLRGRFEWNKRTDESVTKSIEYFNQAIEKDPAYALAYAGLADAYNVATSYLHLPSKEVFPRAKAAAIKAVELDDTLAEAHSALATAKSNDWDWPGTEREFRRAIELNPGYPTAHYFYGLTYLCPMGRFDEAITELQKAVELDPFSAILNANLGYALYQARRHDDAIVQLRKVLEIAPNFGPVHPRLSASYEEKGMYEEAIAEMENVTQGDPAYLEPKELAMLRQAYAVSGMRGYRQKRLELLKHHAKQRYIWPWVIARMPARLGDKDQAFEWLEKAYEARDEWVRFVRVDPAFDNLRSDPRYADLLRRMGLPP
jgi:Tfp pilus assembly protein PilF